MAGITKWPSPYWSWYIIRRLKYRARLSWMFSHGNLQLIINKNVSIALATNIKISEENHLEFLYFIVNKAKGQISEWVLQENNACQRVTPWVRNVRFFEKFGVFSFLVTVVLRFALLPYYRRFSFFYYIYIISLSLVRSNVYK